MSTTLFFLIVAWFKVAADTLKCYQEESVQYQEEQNQKERQKYLDVRKLTLILLDYGLRYYLRPPLDVITWYIQAMDRHDFKTAAGGV